MSAEMREEEDGKKHKALKEKSWEFNDREEEEEVNVNWNWKLMKDALGLRCMKTKASLFYCQFTRDLFHFSLFLIFKEAGKASRAAAVLMVMRRVTAVVKVVKVVLSCLRLKALQKQRDVHSFFYWLEVEMNFLRLLWINLIVCFFMLSWQRNWLVLHHSSFFIVILFYLAQRSHLQRETCHTMIVLIWT